MRNEVFVKFAGIDDIGLRCAEPMALDAARQWLDQEFQRLGATISRPTGKVLLADKVLAIAEAAGSQAFADAAWAENYARAAAGALRRPLIRVDVPNTSVAF
ncbi:MAG: hypothetical protein MUF08_15860 [Burkholderiaceae bacterium]|jgi:hypothetical protein|nr:hypothetical protein [Burkholderiaceae bacterium]